MASMVDVMKFFELRPSEFKPEWQKMTDKDKEDLKNGIGDGSLNY